MLTTRLWMGSVLIALMMGVLIFDQNLPGYPFQFVVQLTLAYLGCRELMTLLGPGRSIHRNLAYFGVFLFTITPWLRSTEFIWKFGIVPPGYWLWDSNAPTWG